VEYDIQLAAAPLVYDTRRKIHVRRKPKEGFVSKAVREFFPSVVQLKAGDKKMEQARSFANRCYGTFKRKRDLGIDGEEPNAKKRYRSEGAGRKAVAPEVREAAFQWFVDVRGGLKGRLPRKLFRLKCLELFEKWKETQNAPDTQLMFGNKWIHDWMSEYRVSLKHPNKTYALAQAERIKRIKLTPPPAVHTQFAPKGSYRLEMMLGTIDHLTNRHNPFSCRNYALYILDDYSVHITEEVRKAFLARGYILVCIGGGITGDIQVNDTHFHHPLKMEYRQREAALMLEQLRENRNRIPSPSRDEMMTMLCESWQALDIDPKLALKNVFVLNALDGSEDFLVSDKLFELVGREIVDFRREMMQTPPPKTVQELVRMITPPKGVRRKANDVQDVLPPDEGRELIDCEGRELTEAEVAVELNYEEGADIDDEVEGPPDTQANIESSEPGTSKMPSSSNSARTVCLAAQLTKDDSIKGDAQFLDEMKQLLENHKTSALFIPYYVHFKLTYTKARSSIKKRLLSKASIFPKGGSSTPSTSIEDNSIRDTASDNEDSNASRDEPDAMDATNPSAASDLDLCHQHPQLL
jgi:hypothetical protein